MSGKASGNQNKIVRALERGFDGPSTLKGSRALANLSSVKIFFNAAFLFYGGISDEDIRY